MVGCAQITDAGLAHLTGIHTLNMFGCNPATIAPCFCIKEFFVKREGWEKQRFSSAPRRTTLRDTTTATSYIARVACMHTTRAACKPHTRHGAGAVLPTAVQKECHGSGVPYLDDARLMMHGMGVVWGS
jgi:hypothetical protein